MADFHSVWLMPHAADERRLSAIVDELAAEFDAPRFRPHLTLVEDNATDAAELERLAGRLGAGITAFAAAIAGIGATDLYYRSLYARFAAAGPLLELKRRAIATIAFSPIADFLPHVSLLYGVAEGPHKRQAVAALEQRLAGAAIRFDRVAVVRSAKSIPISEWAVRAAFPLGPSSSEPHGAAGSDS